MLACLVELLTSAMVVFDTISVVATGTVVAATVVILYCPDMVVFNSPTVVVTETAGAVEL